MSVTNSNKVIEVVVGPNGVTRVETRGFEGAACRSADAFLQKALGRAAAEQLKPEFYAERVGESCSNQIHG